MGKSQSDSSVLIFANKSECQNFEQQPIRSCIYKTRQLACLLAEKARQIKCRIPKRADRQSTDTKYSTLMTHYENFVSQKGVHKLKHISSQPQFMVLLLLIFIDIVNFLFSHKMAYIKSKWLYKTLNTKLVNSWQNHLGAIVHLQIHYILRLFSHK